MDDRGFMNMKSVAPLPKLSKILVSERVSETLSDALE